MGIDADHLWGQDLNLSSAGSIAPVQGSEWSSQRVIRRLLTCKGDDPFNPTYGGNLSQQVGRQPDIGQITAIVRQEMKNEASVDQTQTVNVNVYKSDDGTVLVAVTYVSTEGDTVALSPIPIS